MTDDIPDNVDLRWIARLIIEVRGDLRGLADEMRSLRSDFGALDAIVRRVEDSLTAVEDNLAACREEARQFNELYRE